jgi:hypothetical protein
MSINERSLDLLSLDLLYGLKHGLICTIVDNDEYCHRPYEFEVSWSDRNAKVCSNHLETAKHNAANDSSGDRTNNPHVRKIDNSKDIEILDYLISLVERNK